MFPRKVIKISIKILDVVMVYLTNIFTEAFYKRICLFLPFHQLFHTTILTNKTRFKKTKQISALIFFMCTTNEENQK